MEQLHTQLVMLSSWMPQLAQHGSDFDLSLDDSDESISSIHKQRRGRLRGVSGGFQGL